MPWTSKPGKTIYRDKGDKGDKILKFLAAIRIYENL
jgi:hypothetical protein